jgi:hypothetical protein
MRKVMLALGLAMCSPCGALAQQGGHFDAPALDFKSSGQGVEERPALTLEGVAFDTIDPGSPDQTYRLHVAEMRPHCKLSGVGRARARLYVKLFYEDGSFNEQVIREFASGSDADQSDETSTVTAVAAKLPIRVDYRFDGRCDERR